ncbi:MAG: hypothetical protein V1882_08375, partial [Candidatus Omnitrophota bacterium]
MPMMHDDEELPDWEVKDEEPPERLQKKWEQEEARGPRKILCRACKKETPTENLTCIFCGTDLDFKNEGDQCRPNYRNGKEMKSSDGSEVPG